MTTVIIGSPVDGLVLSRDGQADVVASLVGPGLRATTTVEQRGVEGWADLVAFFAGMSDHWRGWRDVRRWQSVDHVLSIEARHTGFSVELVVVLRPLPHEGEWSCRSTFFLEVGEQLRHTAEEIDALR